jgi:RNA polymerase sigma factor (sigma-70 family)
MHADYLTDHSDLRRVMLSIAYRMTGSVAESEDILQEAFFRMERALRRGVVVDSPKAYLAAATTRLAIDHLRSVRVLRESYVGTWLPEPIVTDLHESPGQMAELSDSLSMDFLVLLENLSPVERAVFLLREVFDYPYEDIAHIVHKGEDQLPADLCSGTPAHRCRPPPLRVVHRARRDPAPVVYRSGSRRGSRSTGRTTGGRRRFLRRRRRQGDCSPPTSVWSGTGRQSRPRPVQTDATTRNNHRDGTGERQARDRRTRCGRTHCQRLLARSR